MLRNPEVLGSTPNVGDSLKYYLQTIKEIPLLSPEEERRLANASNGGDYSAREMLVTSNLRYVVTIASQYQGRGLPLLDLIQEGTIGLIDSIENFDPDRGLRLLTYANLRIRGTIHKALGESGTSIRLTEGAYKKMNRLSVAEAKFFYENNRYPSDPELVELTGMSIRVLATYRQAKKASQQLSLDKPIGSEEDDFLLGDVISNRSDTEAEAMLGVCELEMIQQVVKCIGERNTQIVFRFLGLYGDKETQIDIANSFNVTNARINQIITRSLERLSGLPYFQGIYQDLFDV